MPESFSVDHDALHRPGGNRTKLCVGVPEDFPIPLDPDSVEHGTCVICDQPMKITRVLVNQVRNAGERVKLVCYPCAVATGLMVGVQVPDWQVRQAVADGEDPIRAAQIADYYRGG